MDQLDDKYIKFRCFQFKVFTMSYSLLLLSTVSVNILSKLTKRAEKNVCQLK